MVEGEVQAHLDLYGASGCQRHLSLTVDLQSGHGSGHEKGALWQRRAPLNTDTRVSASMKQNLDKGLDDDRVAGNGHLSN